MARSARGESESKTRRTRIDPKLVEQGWKVVPFDPSLPRIAYANHAVTAFPTANGPADYALFVAGRLLAVVEGKRVTLGPQNVLTQAERYARGLHDSPFDFRGFRAPFLYSTNGELFWFHDIREELSRSRRVSTVHTPAALQEMMARDFAAASAWFTDNANDHPRLRPYQIEANQDRFPEDFAYQLTQKEFTSLMSQIAISNTGRGGRRKPPWVFTEHDEQIRAIAEVLNRLMANPEPNKRRIGFHVPSEETQA